MFTTYKLDQINHFYSKDTKNRYLDLINRFKEVYQCEPDFISRAPGRVNIIGEHIDYEGYGVFPSAIQKDCLVAVKVQESNTVQIHHFDQNNYPSYKTKNDPLFKQQYPNKYLTYSLAGYRAGTQNIDIKQLVGMKIMITGNVPIGCGVSSSAALVVSSALASFYANKQKGKKQKSQFIEACIRRQRQCGVASGGMDQSISVMGKLSSCLYIQFNPIRCEKVNVPSGCKLIIMNSLVENLKANTAIFRYNKRVVQCRLALFLISKNLDISSEIYKQWKILKDLQQYLNLSLKLTSSLIEKYIPRKKYLKSQIEQLLGKDIWSFVSDIQLFDQVLQANQYFNLFQAAKHVFQQAQRVIDLIQVCNSNLVDHKKNVFFGKLMNQSHESCKNLYNCSCEELDELTQTALKNGALGSRLTGAGWGGCTVSLVQQQKVQQFIEKMKQTYYAKQPYKSRAQRQGIQNVIFESKPSQGACIISLK